MNNTDIAWAAGFFDGEGTIRIKPKRVHNTFVHSLKLGNTNEHALIKLKEMFGGNIGAPDATGNHKLPYRTWEVTHGAARRAIEQMLPYLVVKQQLAIAFLECKTDHDFLAFRQLWMPRATSTFIPSPRKAG